MRRAETAIWDLVQTITDSMGYEFVGAEIGQAENGMTLRVYIDRQAESEAHNQAHNEDGAARDGGVLVDDCAAVSRQVSAALDVEDLISGEYCLEVSSPGINRPIFGEQQFVSQIGEEVKIKMLRSVGTRRNFKGVLESVDSGELTLKVDGEIFNLAIADVEQARLVFKFD